MHFLLAVVSDQSLIVLSITYTISLTGMFQYVIRQSAEVENLVSISAMSCQPKAILAIAVLAYSYIFHTDDIFGKSRAV